MSSTVRKSHCIHDICSNSLNLQVISERERESMKNEFKDVEFFSATSDIWTRSNRSYIAVSIHYFDADMLLQTKFIACERFTGNHVNERIAQKLRNIFDRYEITNRVFYLTTDGESAYVAAGKYHTDDYRSVAPMDDEVDFEYILASAATGPGEQVCSSSAADGPSGSNVEPVEEEVDSEDDFDEMDVSMIRNVSELNGMPYAVNPEYSSTPAITTAPAEDNDTFNVHVLFPSGDDNDDLELLPKLNRISCSAHLLDNLGKKDALKALLNPDYSRAYKKAFGTLQNIWRIPDSRLNDEIFHRITGKRIIGPHRIRWSRTFDAVSCSVFVLFSI